VFHRITHPVPGSPRTLMPRGGSMFTIGSAFSEFRQRGVHAPVFHRARTSSFRDSLGHHTQLVVDGVHDPLPRAVVPGGGDRESCTHRQGRPSKGGNSRLLNDVITVSTRREDEPTG
jgi:hypothetical protein